MDFHNKEILKRYVRMATGRPFAPILLNILITSVCDMRCVHCFFTDGSNAEARSGSGYSPPGAVALIVRNLLRVMDVPLIALVLFSPLRQRFGDLAAGTVVVTAGSGETSETEEDEKSERQEKVLTGPKDDDTDDEGRA